MVDLLSAIVSWKTFVLAVAVFGFAPGFVLRAIVRVYPKDDPRRAELVAELYTMKRLERPIFVAEQIETVIFEGLPHRIDVVRHRLHRKRRSRLKVSNPRHQPWSGLVGTERHATCAREAMAGNREAWDVLVEELTPLVWHIARGRGFSRDESEEVVHGVWLGFLKLMSANRDVPEPQEVVRWLVTSTRGHQLPGPR